MTTTMTPNWRDLTELLTPEQVKWLEDFERTEADTDPAKLPLILETVARDYIRVNRAEALYAHVPKPADAVSVETWDDPYTEDAFRSFDGTERTIHGVGGGDAGVDIQGLQYPDGRVERWVKIHDEGSQLTSAQAREIAAALNAAADELDELAELDGNRMPV